MSCKCPYCGSYDTSETWGSLGGKAATWAGNIAVSVGISLLTGGSGRPSGADCNSAHSSANQCDTTYECNKCGREFRVE